MPRSLSPLCCALMCLGALFGGALAALADDPPGVESIPGRAEAQPSEAAPVDIEPTDTVPSEDAPSDLPAGNDLPPEDRPPTDALPLLPTKVDEDLFPGEIGVLEDLEFEDDLEEVEESGGEGAVGGEGAAFDSDVLRSELLPGGFKLPLERQGFRFGVGVQSSYDSNIFADDNDAVDDFVFTLSPSVEYRSAPPGVPGQVTASYTPYVRLYATETDLNTIDHSLAATVSYTGVKGFFSLGSNYGRFSRTDRFVGGVVTTDTFSLSASTSYRIGSRTSLNASASGNFSSDSDRKNSRSELKGSSDNNTWQGQIGAFWDATPKTKFGPSVRYSHNSSDSSGDRKALAFLLNVEHTPREGIALSASAGIERVDSDQYGEDKDTNFTGSLGANYRPNDRFSFQGNLSYQAIPQGGQQFGRDGGGSQSLTGNFSARYTPNPVWAFGLRALVGSFPSANFTNYSIDDQTYGASVTRNLPNGALTLDGSVSFSGYDQVGSVDTSRSDENFYTLGLRYNRSVFAERATLNSSLQWSQNSGNEDWERFQAALGLNVSF